MLARRRTSQHHELQRGGFAPSASSRNAPDHELQIRTSPHGGPEERRRHSRRAPQGIPPSPQISTALVPTRALRGQRSHRSLIAARAKSPSDSRPAQKKRGRETRRLVNSHFSTFAGFGFAESLEVPGPT